MAKFSDVNTILSGTVSNDVANVFFKLKTVLKAAGWTVPSSSDGTTYNSSGDQITTNVAGAGGMNNNRAWFVIREPGGRREWCFQQVVASNYRVKYSALAKFSGGSPSATQVPQASDEQVLLGAGTNASPSGAGTLLAGNTRVHIVANSTPIGGVYPWLWWATTTPGGVQTFGAMWQEPMAPGSYDVADVDPCIVGVDAGGSGIPTMMQSSSRTWFAYGLGGAAWATMNSGANATFNGALAPDLASGKDINGRPIYTATVGGQTRVKGYGATVAIKGPARAWPATANRTSDAYVYLSTLALPYADNTEPGV